MRMHLNMAQNVFGDLAKSGVLRLVPAACGILREHSGSDVPPAGDGVAVEEGISNRPAEG
jgi:hypothetical protein